MFDLGTGEKKEVLLLVNRVEDATVFSEFDAKSYMAFVSRRATNISWSMEGYPSHPWGVIKPLGQPNTFVIKGLQYV